MKKTGAVVCAGVLAAFLCGSAYAVNGKPADQGQLQKKAQQRQEQRLEQMTAELNLSAEQKQKVGAALKSFSDKMQAEMRRMAEVRKAARAETDRQIRAILTPEQQQKFEQLQQKQQAELEKRMKSSPRAR